MLFVVLSINRKDYEHFNKIVKKIDWIGRFVAGQCSPRGAREPPHPLRGLRFAPLRRDFVTLRKMGLRSTPRFFHQVNFVAFRQFCRCRPKECCGFLTKRRTEKTGKCPLLALYGLSFRQGIYRRAHHSPA